MPSTNIPREAAKLDTSYITELSVLQNTLLEYVKDGTEENGSGRHFNGSKSGRYRTGLSGCCLQPTSWESYISLCMYMYIKIHFDIAMHCQVTSWKSGFRNTIWNLMAESEMITLSEFQNNVWLECEKTIPLDCWSYREEFCLSLRWSYNWNFRRLRWNVKVPCRSGGVPEDGVLWVPEDRALGISEY